MGTDEQEIAGVLIRYATGIDQRDWPLFRTCFTDDVLAEYEGIATWEGIDALTDYMVSAHADLGRTSHRISDIAIELQGDTATARSHVDAALALPGDGSRRQVRARYDDRLARTAAGWRISHRRATLLRPSELT